MKIRTTEQLVDELSAELSWRRKELTDLRYVLQSSLGKRTRQDLVTRAGVALLYAHWEGFVKSAAESYLEFVCMQRCTNAELADNILAILLRSKLFSGQTSNKINAHVDIVEFFRNEMDERHTLPYKSAVRTDANLSSVVLREILRTLGLESVEYETKSHLIDDRLLAKRNHIAHGNELDIDSEEYLSLQDEIMILMNLLRNQIENAAAMRHYLKNQIILPIQPSA